MQFESFNAFLEMGGYGFYVWLSYGTTAALLLLLLFTSLQQNKAIKQKIITRQKRENKLRQAATQKAKQVAEQEKSNIAATSAEKVTGENS